MFSLKKKERENNIFNLDMKRYDDISDILIKGKFYKKKKIEYLNLPISFDIETSSFYYSSELKDVKKDCPKIQTKYGELNDDRYEKVGCMYMFGVGINGRVAIGRTYSEFIKWLYQIQAFYDLKPNERHAICYIHNASYEFQFIRKHLNIVKMFAIKEREPIYFVCDLGIEFRCSYLLSGYKLENLPLLKYDVKKLVGSLDYDLIRHPKSRITKDEYDYLIVDNLCVMAYIKEYMEKLGNNITRIPFTKTGVVRKLCRDNCFYVEGSHKNKSWDKYNNYNNYIHNMNITSVYEYEQLKRAFMGGFTHANNNYVGVLLKNVTSFDFTSSYP